MRISSRSILNMAFIGLSTVATLNVYGHLVLHQSAAELFSHQWWSTWAPSYMVWFVFLVVGCHGVLRKQSR